MWRTGLSSAQHSLWIVLHTKYIHTLTDLTSPLFLTAAIFIDIIRLISPTASYINQSIDDIRFLGPLFPAILNFVIVFYFVGCVIFHLE